MKTISILFLLSIFCYAAAAQTSMVNLRAGSWKMPHTWLYERVPNDTDNVVLMRDILVDVNATCRSLTTNGYNVTVAPGYHLTITGHDSLATADTDTLIAALSVVYVGDTTGGDVIDQVYKKYEYDAQKRVSKTIVYDDDAEKTTLYFYNGNSRLPYKIIHTDPCDEMVNDQCLVHNDTSYYTYNADGIVIRDSSRSLEGLYALHYKRVYRYDISSDSVIRYGAINNFTISIGINDTTAYEYFEKDTVYYQRILNNGNIVYQFANSRHGHDEHIFTQDHHKNPLYPGSVHLPVLPLEMLLFQDPEQLNNNLTHEESYSVEGSDQSIKFRSAFYYKANGYPAEVIMIDEPDNSVFIIRYEYTK